MGWEYTIPSYAIVFGVLALLLLRAYVKREELELDALEVHLTRSSLAHHLATVVIAMMSIGLLLLGYESGWAGVIYFLMAPAHTILGFVGGFRADRIKRELIES